MRDRGMTVMAQGQPHSAHISSDARARLTVAGADGFITKPFKTTDIQAAVAEFTATTTASIVSNRLQMGQV